ncbi:hypothetical protein HYS31_05330 [Candidatus Woesearchaeota archaeon]|nr:hypothetical protein [Candidatus Woesearchaeota archaeon]
MDFFAHGLWTYAIFHKKEYKWWAALFGLLPDALSFGLFVTMNILAGNKLNGPPPLSTIPKFVFVSYNYTHSLVVFGIIFLLICLITKKWLWPLAAWGIHIITDIPTHSTSFFPTPFLWPISSYNFNGISWANGWFMILNYAALMCVFILIARNKRFS